MPFSCVNWPDKTYWPSVKQFEHFLSTVTNWTTLPKGLNEPWQPLPTKGSSEGGRIRERRFGPRRNDGAPALCMMQCSGGGHAWQASKKEQSGRGEMRLPVAMRRIIRLAYPCPLVCTGWKKISLTNVILNKIKLIICLANREVYMFLSHQMVNCGIGSLEGCKGTFTYFKELSYCSSAHFLELELNLDPFFMEFY